MTSLKDRYFLERYDRIMRDFDAYMKSKDTWFSRTSSQLLMMKSHIFLLNMGCMSPSWSTPAG